MKDSRNNRGFKVERFSANRHMVAASSTAARKFNTIHIFLEVDVTEPRKLIKEYERDHPGGLSFTAYLVHCLSQAVAKHPSFNSFRRGNKLIILDDLTISVLIERELDQESIPEPLGIRSAQMKDIQEIQDEIRGAQGNRGNALGDLTGSTWIRFIPSWLLGFFIGIFSRNIKMAQRYGKVAVTAVGMFSPDRSWMVPLSSATVLLTVGGIHKEIIPGQDREQEAEYLHLTLSFNHDIIDGAPAARFAKDLESLISSGESLKTLKG